MAQKNVANYRPQTIVYYPPHGVGVIQPAETIEMYGVKQKFVVLWMPRDRSTLRIPADKAVAAGLISTVEMVEPATLKNVLGIIAKKRHVSRRIWSQRASVLEFKIHSNLIHVAEAVRDLNRELHDETSTSYSEIQLLEKATDRFLDILATGTYTNFTDTQTALNHWLKSQGKRALPLRADQLGYEPDRPSQLPILLKPQSHQDLAAPADDPAQTTASGDTTNHSEAGTANKHKQL